MYLSAERLALANQTIQETFEQTSVAWQAIPHWDTGDPGQSTVRADDIDNPTAPALTLDLVTVPFNVTLAQAISPTPDAMLAQVMDKTVELTGLVDDKVLPYVRAKAKAPELSVGATPSPQDILNKLIRRPSDCRGRRVPGAVLPPHEYTRARCTHPLSGGYYFTDALATAANVNSIQRSTIDIVPANKDKIRMILLGRRQRIAHGRAADASPGEEPVDLAVSVLPSLEIIGETPANEIELIVRIRFATRIKDASGIVAIKGT